MSWCHFRKRDSSDAVPRSSRFRAKAARPIRHEPYRSHRPARNRSRLPAILHCPRSSRSYYESELPATHITPIVADLNDKVDLAKVEAKLKEDSSITMLVNNAGMGAVVPLLNADIDKMEEM